MNNIIKNHEFNWSFVDCTTIENVEFQRQFVRYKPCTDNVNQTMVAFPNKQWSSRRSGKRSRWRGRSERDPSDANNG